MNETEQSKRARVLPPVYLLIAMTLMLALHFLFPVARLIPSPWNALGVILLLLGIDLELTADGLLHKLGTTVNPDQEPSILVTTGVYAISRNPMYLGFVLLLAGIAAILGTLTPFLILPVFTEVIDKMFVSLEESRLEQKFGPAFLAYRQKVRRWI